MNCKVFKVSEDSKLCIINGIEFKPRDPIAIDGRLGNIYKGNNPIIYAPMELP
ncbi:hypothetical protein JW979_12255 [bacterium]|nr:hypothetical protein [candidate division CSSED10-310 bacterium]